MRKALAGFTMIEIIVIIAVIGILSTIGVVSYINIQQTTRDRQRTSNISIIAEALEKYYDQNGQYPDCSELATLNNAKSTLPDVNDEAFKTPKGGSFSIDCGTIPSVDKDVLFYEDKGTSGWALRYYSETKKNEEIGAKNRRTITNISINNNGLTLKVIKTLGGDVDIVGNNASGNSVTIVATADTGYSFYNWTGGPGCAGEATHNITINQNIECTAHFTINKPIMTDIAASAEGISTTWSWAGVTCPAGTSAEYQYYFLTSSGYFEDYGSAQDSLYVLPTTTSYRRTTNSEGATYTLSVKVRCVDNTNSTNVSEWSDPKSASYTRPVASFTLTLIAGTGGSTSGGGSFTSGSTATITAAASTGYSFSSWTGSSGCAGVVSHTITMNENKSCTANFTVNKPAAPVVSNIIEYGKFCLFGLVNCHKITFSWTNTCPTGTTPIFSYNYTNNFDSDKFSSSDSYNENSYVIGGNTANGNEGREYVLSARVKCRDTTTGTDSPISNWSNVSKRYIEVTPPGTVTWSEITRTTYSGNPAIKMGMTSSCGPGSSLYGIADLYSESYDQYNEKTSPVWRLAPNWFGYSAATDPKYNEATWLLSPYTKLTGEGINITVVLYEKETHNIVTVASGSRMILKMKLYCQSDLNGSQSANTGIIGSGYKSVP